MITWLAVWVERVSTGIVARLWRVREFVEDSDSASAASVLVERTVNRDHALLGYDDVHGQIMHFAGDGRHKLAFVG